MLEVAHKEHPANWKSERIVCKRHHLFVFKIGTGVLYIDNNQYHFAPGKSYIVPPGSSLCVQSDFDCETSYFLITFTTLQSKPNDETVVYTHPIIPNRYELSAYPFSRLIRLIEELYAGRDCSSDIEWYTQQLRFMQLMGFVLEHNLRSDHSLSATHSVENTIQYLNRHYMENITVKQLVQLANVSQWQFTPIFQELTGKKPLDYLTDLRINHAKELLRSSDEPLREIAAKVGFADEYYFNRRFRNTAGITPKQYARRMRGKVRVMDWTGHEVDIPVMPQRVIYHGETFGDLIALGVEAIGSASTFIRGTIYEDHLDDIHDIGHPFNSDKSRMLEPDLIIVANEDENLYSTISQIAPTVTFNSFAPLERRLHTLGDLLGKQKEAKLWLDAYTAKESTMWLDLQSHMKTDETASVFIFDHGNRLFVMGTTGLSSALYHPFGFKPGDKIQELLASGQAFMEITTDQLSAYAGDRIFMLLGHNEISRQATHALMQSSLWRKLPAVRNGYVYQVNALHWNLGDALTRERLLQALPLLLARTS
nr:AraC family transcriptional regulator [Paenibacillus sp. SYP-B3998]